MKLKLFFQFFLILLVLFLSYKFFNKYFLQEKKIEITEEVDDNLTLNIIKDISYLSKDDSGNVYEIKAESGLPIDNDLNIVELKNVNAIIKFENSKKIIISSNIALYNQENYDTEFKENVKINFETHNISCDNLKTEFSKNMAYLSGNLIYNNLSTKFFADVMEIDLRTKSTKTYMIDKKDKIEINYTSNGNN